MNESHSEDIKPPLEIPAESLSEEALLGVIDNFIQREGTDYGVHEVAYESKIEQIKKQISKGRVKIVFDPNIESVSLMTELEWKRFSISQK
jgi:uncharacterized protein YheU (UPF0270 family)